MINCLTYIRKRNTYIYILILIIIFSFSIYSKDKINELNLNRVEYENYIVIKKDMLKDIDKNDILMKEDCILFSEGILSVDNELEDNEMILSYLISEDNSFIKDNNIKIVDYKEESYVNENNFKKLSEDYEVYYKLHLKEIVHYEKYYMIISKSIYYNETLNIQNTKESLKMFNMVFKLIMVLIIFMIILLVINMIYDNKKYIKLLEIFGYTKRDISLMLLSNIMYVIFVSYIISYIINIFIRVGEL